jgi:hypothetical protein
MGELKRGRPFNRHAAGHCDLTSADRVRAGAGYGGARFGALDCGDDIGHGSRTGHDDGGSRHEYVFTIHITLWFLRVLSPCQERQGELEMGRYFL